MSRTMILPAALMSMTLMVAALWVWQQAPHRAIDAEQPEIVLWGMRSAAVAAGALAQTVLLFFVVGGLYRARRLDVALRALSVVVLAISSAGAVALAWMGR